MKLVLNLAVKGLKKAFAAQILVFMCKFYSSKVSPTADIYSLWDCIVYDGKNSDIVV